MHRAGMDFSKGRRARAALCGAAGMALGLPYVAHGQSVNYQGLQDMFREPVTTSVTGKPQRASEAPAALVIITRDDIRRSPARDIPGLIQAHAGIDVVRWTAGQAGISVRGGVQPYDPRLLVLVNGRQVYLDHYGLTNWAGIGVQLEEIQQIEIVRGPNSALFGFNAVSGVINIITINPLHTRQLVSTVEAGNAGYLRLSQSAAIKLDDDIGLRLSGGLGRSAELAGLKASPLARLANDLSVTPAHKEILGELYARIDQRTAATLSGSYSDSRQLEFPVQLVTTPFHYRFGTVGAHIEHDTGWSVLSAKLQRNWSSIDLTQADLPDGVRLHNDVFIASGDAMFRPGVADMLRFGVEYRRNQMVTAPGFPGATRYDVYAANSMWEHRLNDAATFTLAGRIDHLRLSIEGEVNQPSLFTKQDFDRSITAFSFNSALLLKLDAMSTLRFAVSRGIQAPSLFAFGARVDIKIATVPFPVVISGNPAIKPARITSAEFGFIHTFESIDGHLDLTAFFNRTTDINGLSGRSTPPRAMPPAYPFVLTTSDNIGSFTAYGIEASLIGGLEPNWQWALNYTWTGGSQDIVGNVGTNYGRPLAMDRATPLHKIKAQLSHESGPMLATVAARYTSPIQQLVSGNAGSSSGLSLIRVPASLAIDAKLAFRINDTATFTVAGDNLTDAGSVGLSPAPAERRLRAGVQLRF